MANKEELKKIAELCSEHRYIENPSLRSDAEILGETIQSCENCIHFTQDHKCDINLVDEILSNMAEVEYDQIYEDNE